MTENVTVITEGANGGPIVTEVPIPVSENASEEMEITSEWLESLFGSLNQSMQASTEILRQLLLNQTEMSQAIQMFSTRVPENLTQMISSQQETIQGLVRESMETVRNLLTQPAQPVIVEQEPQSEEVVLEVPETAPVPERQKPKRHRI
jgi:hypothetical protein